MKKVLVIGATISTKMTEYAPQDGWHGLGKQTESLPFDRYETMLSTFAALIREERGYEAELETEARIHRCLLAACGLPCDYNCEINL